MSKKQSKLLIYSILSLVIGLLLAYYVRGNIFMLMFSSLLFFIGFIPALIGFLICKLISRKKKTERIANLVSTFKILMAITIILTLTIPIGLSFRSDDIEKTQEFCNELALEIEKEREKTGTYPSDIEALLRVRGEIPRLIDERRLYRKINGSYELTFVVTGGLFPRLYEYSSKTKNWEILD